MNLNAIHSKINHQWLDGILICKMKFVPIEERIMYKDLLFRISLAKAIRIVYASDIGTNIIKVVSSMHSVHRAYCMANTPILEHSWQILRPN